MAYRFSFGVYAQITRTCVHPYVCEFYHLICFKKFSFLFFFEWLLTFTVQERQANSPQATTKSKKERTKHKTQNTCIKRCHTQRHQNIIKKKLLISNWAKSDQLRVPGRMGNITSMTPSWTSTSQTHRILKIGTNSLTHRKLYYIEWSEFIEIRGQARKPYPL